MLLVSSLFAGADWPTNRGNPERTGNTDQLPGPKTAGISWAYKAQENFIATPVVNGKFLYVSSLGAFNTGQFHALSTEPVIAERMLWTKSAPYLKLPTVSAPAIVGGLMYFGDGMHQTDGAILHCLQPESGLPIWDYAVPGHLVHMEGSPAVVKGHVFIGGGDAGVVCVDSNALTLDKKEIDLAAATTLIQNKWKELTAKFEQDKKNNPDLALPPSEDSLPRPSPKLLWQQGKGKWHVDASVNVVGDKVLVASAFLPDEKTGDCALICLNAADGANAWETKLKYNPWGGASIAGNLALVACSSIRFDKKDIKGAAGEVVAIDIASGAIKWRKEIPGGVLSPVAVKDELAVFTGTDGKVYCFTHATGEQRWVYEAKNPFFAGPAVAGGYAYVADLKGTAYSLNLGDGTPQWIFDVSNDPGIRIPGMFFGSPVVAGGRVYLNTCNLESEIEQPMVVVCIGERDPSLDKPKEHLTLDKASRTITIPCRIAPRKLATLKEIYPIEVVAAFGAPKGQKAHETVLVYDVLPSDVHKALEQLGLKPGQPARGESDPATGPIVKLSLQLPGFNGKPRLIPMEKTLVDKRTGKLMPPLQWHFTGSSWRQLDPDKPEKTYAADVTGTLITVFPVTDETVFQSNLTMKEEPWLKMDTNLNLLPDENTSATLVIQVP